MERYRPYVIYDRASKICSPRVQVILEEQKDEQKFRDGLNFDNKKQEVVASEFLKIIKKKHPNKYDINGLFVIFTAFAPIAKEEADSKLCLSRIP